MCTPYFVFLMTLSGVQIFTIIYLVMCYINLMSRQILNWSLLPWYTALNLPMYYWKFCVESLEYYRCIFFVLLYFMFMAGTWHKWVSSGVILEIKDTSGKDKKGHFPHKKLWQGTSDLSNTYVHSMFTLCFW